MLDDLVGVIETLKTRIQDHRADLQASETRTRMALIDPLLTVLGWDASDPRLVTPEYDVNGKRADYALLNGHGAPVVFLEAKKLDQDLSNHRSQVAAYASELGIKYPALTNGNDWEVYDNSKLIPIEQRNILNVSIAKDPVHQVALKLLLLWRANLASGQPIEANEPIITVSTQVEQTKKDQQTPTPPNNEGWTSLLNLPPDVSWHDYPSTIRFPNGDERPVNPKNWKHVLIEASEWLIQNGGLTKDKCPIGQDSNRYIIHTEPMHPSGKSFHNPAQLSNGLFMAPAANAKRAANDCVYLMACCSQDSSGVEIRLA